MAVMADADDFQLHLQRFIDSLRRGPSGVDRPAHEQEALIAVARDMLGRMVAPLGPLGEALAPGAAFRPNQVVAGVFTIQGLIRRGGMGELYRARHRELGTDHALKTLRPGFSSNQDAIALLRNEARLLAIIRSDAVVGGQGLLRDSDGRLVLVMELLRGPDLERTLRNGPMEAPQVAVLGQRIAAGLQAIHRHGVVHQDISPGNIVLCDNQAAGATLVDFGVARLLGDLHGPHDHIDFAGKLTWASPEQLTYGSAVDARSDLYSLGLVLAAAARGEPIPMGHDELVAVRERRRVPPMDGVPPALHPVLTRLLQPAPGDRPATAAAAAALLTAAITLRPRGFFGRRAP